MSDKARQFSLPLSALTAKSVSKSGSYSIVLGSIATPQTATRNVAGHHERLQRSNSPQEHAWPVASAANAALAVRQAMVERLARKGITNAPALAAMGAIPRHIFLESAFANPAYADVSLPIGHQQTISQPYIVARMLELLQEEGGDGRLGRVLEVGTGCGYQAAVLTQLAKEVYSIERIRALHELAKKNLRLLRLPNLRLQYGDGMLGIPQAAPFDGIILAAAGPQMPSALLEQLAVGGRMVAPVGAPYQSLKLVVRVSQREWVTTTWEDCNFVPLRSGVVG